LLNQHFWADCTFRHKSGFWQNFSITSPETLYTEKVVNELSFMPVTQMTCFYTWFGHYRFLKSGSSADQVLDRLGIQVIGQVFGPQDVQNMLGYEYKF
jgi:hypothetical protein